MLSLILIIRASFQKSQRKSSGKKQIEQIQSIEGILNHVIYVITQILKNQVLSQTQFLQYILFNHKKLCQNTDCPLKKLDVQNIKIKKEDKEGQQILVGYVKLYLKEVLKTAIEVYQQEESLKILDIYFNYEIFEEHIETYTRIQNLKQSKINSESLYMISFLEEEMFQQNLSSKDQQDEKNLQTAIFSKKIIKKKFDTKIEQIVYYYLDFWTLLKQDLPDLDKIIKFGKKIIILREELEKIVQSLDNKTQQDIQILYDFSIFLREVTKDNQKFDKVMEVIKCQLEENCQQETNNTKWLQNMDLNQQPYSIAIIKFDQVKENFELFDANDAFCSLFQFSKEQIYGKDFGDIIPFIFRKEYLLKLKEQIKIAKSHIQKQHFFFFIDKQQYIIPVICKTMRIESNLAQEIKIILQIHYNPEFDNSAFVLLTKNLDITNISFSCKNILGIQKISYYQNPSVEFWCQGITKYLEPQQKGYKTKAQFKLVSSQYSGPQEEEEFFLQVQTFNFGQHQFLALKINRLDQDNIYNICNIQQQIFEQYSFKNGILKKLEKLKLQKSKRNNSFNNNHNKNAIQEGQSKIEQKNNFEFKGIKLLKLKNNKLYETDFQQKDTQDISIILQEERQKFNLDFVSNDMNIKKIENQDSSSIDSKQKFLLFLKNINYDQEVFCLKLLFHFLIIFTILASSFNIYIIKQGIDDLYNCKQYSFYTNQKNTDFLYISHQIQYNMLYYSYFSQNQLQEKQFDSYIEKNLNDRMSDINNIKQQQRQQKLSYLDLEETLLVTIKEQKQEQKTLIALEETILGKVIDFLQQQNAILKQNNIIHSHSNRYVLNNVLFQLQQGYTNIKQKIGQIEKKKIKQLIVASIVQSLLIGFFSFIFYIYFIKVFKKILYFNQQFMNCFLKIPEEFLNRRIDQIQQYQTQLIKTNGLEDDTRTLTFTNVSKQVKNTYQRKKKFKNQRQLFSRPFVIMSVYFFSLIITYILLICIFQTNKIKNKVENFERFELQNRTELGTMIDFSYLTNRIMNLNDKVYQQEVLGLDLETFPYTQNFVSSFFYQFVNTNPENQLLIDQVEQSYLNFTCHNELIYKNDTSIQECSKDFDRVQLTGIAYIMNYVLDLMARLQNSLTQMDYNRQFAEFYHEISYWTNTHISWNFQNLTNLLQNYSLAQLTKIGKQTL